MRHRREIEALEANAEAAVQAAAMQVGTLQV